MTVIRVDELSKYYTLGASGYSATSLRDTIALRLKRRTEGAGGKPKGFWALRDVSFEVAEGDVLGIVGRNGAGKSTLLKILSRIVAPTNGRATIRGRVGSLLEVGTGFHPELTGRENAYLNGSILGMKQSEIDKKFDEIVDFADVEQFIDTPVKRYSSGMYMRLAFAVAAHLEPEILIIDEVLSVGDVAFQQKCLGKMKDVATQGRTVLYVSHNLPSVASLCRRAILLERGRVVRDGASREIVDQYLEQIQPVGDTSIEHRQDRDGDGRVKISSLHIHSSDADGVIRVNSQLTIAIGYKSDEPFRHPAVRIGIDDHVVGIFGLASDFAGGLPDDLPPEGVIYCRTDSINLAPGRYFVHVLLERAGVLSDYVANAGYFTVEAADIYGTGRLPERDWSLNVLPHQWYVD